MAASELHMRYRAYEAVVSESACASEEKAGISPQRRREGRGGMSRKGTQHKEGREGQQKGTQHKGTEAQRSEGKGGDIFS